MPLEVELDLDPVAVRDFDFVDLDFVPAEDEERFELDVDDVDFLPDDFLVAGILFPPVSIGRSKTVLQSRYHCERFVFGRVENRSCFNSVRERKGSTIACLISKQPASSLRVVNV